MKNIKPHYNGPALIEGEDYYVQKRKEFKNIIETRNINILFQPIVSLSEGRNYGFEALSRGPRNSAFYSPEVLFPFAAQEGCLYTLEKMARELAIKESKGIIQNEKLFINMSAQAIYQSNYTPGNTVSLLQQYHLSPSDIVFEITERSAIHDFLSFRKVLSHYRSQGFQIAVDDAGAGYSSLQAISELEPDYIKVDKSLIHGINESRIKKNILESFTMFAKKMNSKVIAEGIETPEELKMVKDLGIDLGQGFFLARPENPVSSISLPALEILQNKSETCTYSPLVANINQEIIIMNEGRILKQGYLKDLLPGLIN